MFSCRRNITIKDCDSRTAWDRLFHVSGQATANARSAYLLLRRGMTGLSSHEEERPGRRDARADATTRSIRCDAGNPSSVCKAHIATLNSIPSLLRLSVASVADCEQSQWRGWSASNPMPRRWLYSWGSEGVWQVVYAPQRVAMSSDRTSAYAASRSAWWDSLL